MSIPAEIRELVERFDRNVSDYKRGKYNETQVRREFIDPFFKALGWDVDNTKGYAEAYKEVVHEDAVKIGRATKAPDYSFRIGGVRKFFLEAKKPSVDIKHDTHPAYQLRRYAWSAKLPLSILTDFEEFAVYDCRIKPVKTDKAPVARVMYLTYQDYLGQWAELVDIFSPESIRRGSFDKWVETTKAKKGTAEVDNAFLQEIERWRDLLARNFALRNRLSQRQLNFAVQQTIDRLIFLRIAEDRGIERYGRLQELLASDNLYPRLFDLFQKADEKYNSGLFHFQTEKGRDNPDTLTPALTLDDKVLKDILRHLYYPDSPYEFSVLPGDILGQVYEQFLGKVIRLTPKGQAKIEDKPEVKKAGGVYYTPTYIVDYIVRQTVGQLVAGKTPGQISGKNPLRVLDPACGSGSFLLGAYQYLLDWHLDWYVNNDPDKQAQKKNAPIYPAPTTDPDIPNWRLTVDERKRILLTHIYGVDIDPQAVEVTKLSLLLKVLEDEQSVTKQLGLFQERVLPDLDQNIKCGNSLIGYDFYDGQQMGLGLFDEEEQYRINAFDWQTEFAEVMQAGGFDAVIGNPPWGADFAEDDLAYHRKQNKEIIVRMIDSFMYFVYQNSLRLNDRGYFGMIIPDVLFYQVDNKKLREFIVRNFRIESMLNLGNGVFDKVTRPSAIIIYSNNRLDKKHEIRIADFSELDRNQVPLAIFDRSAKKNFLQSTILDLSGFLFVTKNPQYYDILKKVRSAPYTTLSSIVDDDGIQRGVSPDLKKAFLIDSETATANKLEDHKLKRVLTGGKHVKRYYIDYPDLWLIYTTRNDDFGKVPNICKFIDQFKSQITCREVKANKHPLYSLHRPRNKRIFHKPIKLIGVITEDEIVIAPDSLQTFVTDGLYVFGLKDSLNPYYVLATLNSKLFVLIYRLLALETGRVLAQVKPAILKELPIRTINFDDPTDKVSHDKIVSLVEQMLTLHQQLNQSQTPQAKTILQRQIEATDRQIDKLVYQLYNLSEEEIKIVEGRE